MMRMKPTEEPNRIIDARTSDVIFKKRRHAMDFQDLKELLFGPSVPDEFTQPLDDLDVINERLDTIGELVSDSDLRERLSNILDAFGEDYDKSLFRVLEDYIRVGDYWSDYSKGLSTRRLRSVIGSIADVAEKLPSDFGRSSFQTETLNRLSLGYADIMETGSDDSVMEFFEYVKAINERIKEFEPPEEEKAGISDDEGITYDQLRSLLDVRKLKGFRRSLQKLRPFFETALPYVNSAKTAVERNYVRPEVVPRGGNCLIIQNGRWDRLYARGGVIPNDTYLDRDTRVEVLEGVNSGGKTVDIIKALYIASLALSGSWVPTEYARVSIRDRIILREKGRGDAISAFQQDSKNVKETTPPEGEYWLIAMDETFTSTERRGGEALSYGLIHSILDQGDSLMIMSSHYPDLSKDFIDDPRVDFNHFPFERRPSETEEEEKIKVVFPYKKHSGPLKDYKYAIAVSSSRGFDEEVLIYAEQRLAQRGI